MTETTPLEGRDSPAILELALPAIISASSDIDPTSIGTLVVIGSTVMFGLNWLVVLLIPVVSATLMLSGRLGMVTRKGIQEAVRERFPGPIAVLGSMILLVLNVVTLGADVGGGAAALGLLTGVEERLFIVPFVLAIGALSQVTSYEVMKRYLSILVLALFAYIGSAVLAHPDWLAALKSMVVPRFSWNRDYFDGALAIVGGTMTSYVFFWQSVEDAKEGTPLKALKAKQALTPLGVVWSSLLFLFIIVATASTLGKGGGQAETADQAAQALRPLAGLAASYVFAAGLFASAALAVPVLASTSAHAVAETFGWEAGLAHRAEKQRLPYYVVVWAVLLVSCLVPLSGIPPIKLLYYSSIAGAFGLPLHLGMIALLGRNRDLLGRYRAGLMLVGLVWLAVLIAVLAFVFVLVEPVVLG